MTNTEQLVRHHIYYHTHTSGLIHESLPCMLFLPETHVYPLSLPLNQKKMTQEQQTFYEKSEMFES